MIVAAAVPVPRASRACARSTARRAARSASTIRTVPSKRVVTGPSLIVIAPSNVSPSPPASDAPGQARRDALDVEQHGEGLVRGAGTVNSFVELHEPPSPPASSPIVS